MAVLSSLVRRPASTPLPPVRTRKALVAAASQIPLDGTGWKSFKLGDAAWQQEAWKHYDICGELRFVANWIGSSVSRCRLYVAELDELGRPGKEVTDPEIAVLAETVFGGPAKKAEAMRLLGTHLYVPGESYIVAESVENANEDRWYVVSTSAIKRQADQIQVERPQEYGGGWYTLREGKDLLIRAWTPHPRKYDLADSSVRPALPILREIEQLTKHTFAQVDSRLAGAGLLLLPDQLDFPRGDEDPPGASGLMAVLQRAMAAALQDRSDPSSLVPIMAQVPGEFIDKIRHITFETPLTKDSMEIRDRAIRRLGLSLDVDPEILLGKGDTNHWSAWQLEESTIKVHIEPILSRICDAITTGYLHAALEVLGQDPEKFTFWYDPSPLTVRPDRQADGLELFDKDAISEKALREAGSWSEDDAPNDQERARRLAQKLVLADPSLIYQKGIQEALGVQWDLEQPQPPTEPPSGEEPGEEPPAPERPTARERALPSERTSTREGEPSAAQAALLMGAHMVVQRSLELAGKRLLTRANREKFKDVPAWELHTVIHVLEPDHADRLLDDTFSTVPMLAERTGVPADELREALAGYCRELFIRAIPHDIDLLEDYLGWCLGAARDEMEAWLDRQREGGQFHLPGRHDQRNHGRRKGRRDFEPFTPEQKRERAAERRQRKDPDRDAPAPARQGRRAFAAWEEEARVLTGRAQRQMRDEVNRVLDEPGEGADREREWAEKERELREQQADFERNLRKNLADDPELEDMVASFLEASNKRIEVARQQFFGDNPDVLTDQPGGAALHWREQLRRDTGWDAPVRVKDLSVSNYKVRHGWAYRVDGITYVIQGPPDANGGQEDRARTARVAQQLHEIHNEVLPEDADRWQKGYAWLTGQSPGDKYWQERFNNPNHVANASAGDGAVAFWGRNNVQMPGDSERGTIVHEFGHNVDQTSTTGGRISKSVEWQFAMKDDFDGNPGKVGPAKSRVVEFIQDYMPGQHRIDFQEGYGKEAPWGVTTYGKSSLAEDLAESVRLYVRGRIGEGRIGGPDEPQVPVYFRDLFPERAKLLDKEFPEIARRQKAEIKQSRPILRRRAAEREARQARERAERQARGLHPGY